MSDDPNVFETGQATPYHLHHGNEELLIVLDGELELRTPEGKRAVSTCADADYIALTLAAIEADK